MQHLTILKPKRDFTKDIDRLKSLSSKIDKKLSELKPSEEEKIDKLTLEELQDLFKNNKQTIVKFGAEWCGPCKMVDPILQEVSNDINDVTFVKVDVDSLPIVSTEFKIRSIPVIAKFVDGVESDRHIGAITRNGLFEFMA